MVDSTLVYDMHPERSSGRSSTVLCSAQNAPATQSKDAVNQLGNRSKFNPDSPAGCASLDCAASRLHSGRSPQEIPERT